jgi:hypothetical protein
MGARALNGPKRRSLARAGRAAAFAEIYSDPPLMIDFGFDGEFADDKICPQHSGKYCSMNPRSSAIGQGILAANASLIETTAAGPGSVDDLSAQMFRAKGAAFRTSYLKNLPVTVSWLPGSNISSDFASNACPDPPGPLKRPRCFPQ